jgi:hypothetical protein
MAIRWICNVRDWPIAIFELPPNTEAREIDQDSFYEQAEALLAKGERFASMHDVRFAGRMDAVRRRVFTEWVRRHETALGRQVIAHAVIVGSSLQQGVITALRWVMKIPMPMQVFTDPHEGRAWLKERVSASK